MSAVAPRIRLPYPHAGQQVVRRQARRFNWLAAGRRWRKTTMAMTISVEAAAAGQTVIWGAPTYNQVRIGMEETRRAAASAAFQLAGGWTALAKNDDGNDDQRRECGGGPDGHLGRADVQPGANRDGGDAAGGGGRG